MCPFGQLAPHTPFASHTRLEPHDAHASIVSPQTPLLHVGVWQVGASHWLALVHPTHVPELEQNGFVGLSRAQSVFVEQPMHVPP